MMDYDSSERPKILALDLDGTALNYNGEFTPGEFGEALRGMVEELEKLKAAGWKIVIWSCRPDSPEMRAHLDAQGIPYDYINEFPAVAEASKELQQKVRDKWKDLF